MVSRSFCSVILVAALAALAATTARIAHAQGSDEHSHALDLKRVGDVALSERRYLEALEAYDASYAIEASPALDYNRGRALQFLARYPEAVDALERFRTSAPEELRARVPGLDGLIAELHAKVAAVIVSCDIVNARVLVDRRDVGAPGKLRVNAGKTTIEVLADGYFPYRAEVELRGGETTPITAHLASRATFGLVVVRSSVAGSSAFVDEHAIGLTPTEAIVSVGQHPLRVEHEGYVPAHTQVVVGVGERKEITLDPIRSKPITARWWFWTGVGVVVTGVALAVTGIALSIERPAPNGDWNPGKINF